jgi:hypothetical protein
MRETASWTGRELRGKDKAKLAELLEKADKSASLFLRVAFARETRWESLVDGESAPRAGLSTDSWWYGLFRDGTSLEAVMFVEGHVGQLYASSEEAAKGLGNQLYAAQKRLGPSVQTHRHQLIGEGKTMGWVWPIMKDLPDRKVLSDKDCDFLLADQKGDAPSSRAEVIVATRADERAVSDFIAELRIEQVGIDPRKIGREAHTARISDAVGAGRALLGREKDTGRPFFVAEIAPLDAESATLSDVYVPPHYRSRGKLIAQAFWAIGRHPAAGGRSLYFMAADASFATTARSVGWKSLCRYRWTITHG